MNTQYRTISNGYWEFLQYLTTKPYFVFWKKEVWSYVWKPYFHRSYGREDITGSDTFICSLHENLEKFVEKWPNIEDYFKSARVEQERLEYKVNVENAKYAAEKNKTRRLN